jgi:succinoglycan biosynthesis protein ExoM
VTAFGAAAPTNVRVAIGIVTYRRPQWLADSLQSVGRLAVDSRHIDLTVVVVDNDGAAGGRAVVQAAQQSARWKVLYEVEPTQGISFARNRAVRVALEQGAQFVAFIDDDETVDPDWLSELLAAQRAYGAEVISGPVEPTYGADIPEWIVRGRFFERPRYATGTRLDTAITANCLIASSVFVGTPEPFHAAFAITGGGDTHFFRRVHGAGAQIVWADRAVVRERVPRSRANARWILKRAYRGGTSFAQCERLLHQTRRWMPLRIVSGIARSFVGVVMLVPSLLLGKIRTVRTLQSICIGLGLLAGIVGFSYREYTVVHGE